MSIPWTDDCNDFNGNYSTAVQSGDVFGKLKVKKLLNGKKLPDNDEDFDALSALQGITLEGNFTGIELKNGRVGPDISVFGTGELKTAYMVQVFIKNRALYTLAVTPNEKHKVEDLK